MNEWIIEQKSELRIEIRGWNDETIWDCWMAQAWRVYFLWTGAEGWVS